MWELLALACALLATGLIYCTTRIRYRIGARNFEIILFGFRVRKIPLTDIRSASKRRPGWSEKWPNTFFPSKRILFVERRSGRIRHIMITPQHRYAFKADLMRAVNEARNRGRTALSPEGNTDTLEGKD